MTEMPVPQVDFIEIDGHRLEYQSLSGSRTDLPWLVFLHEGLGSLALWKDFPRALCAATGMRGLVYSRYGYGGSEALPAAARPHQRRVDYMHHEAIDVLPALLEALDIEQPVLFGHSDGASIALIHAATYPGVAAGVIALAPHVMVEDLTVRSIARARGDYDTTGMRERLGRYHDDVDSAFWGWNDIWLNPDFRNWNIEDLMPLIDCPVLAIQGKDDEYGTMAQIDSLARRISDFTPVALDNCHHSPHRDRPQAVIEACSEFLSRLRRQLPA